MHTVTSKGEQTHSPTLGHITSQTIIWLLSRSKMAQHN